MQETSNVAISIQERVSNWTEKKATYVMPPCLRASQTMALHETESHLLSMHVRTIASFWPSG